MSWIIILLIVDTVIQLFACHFTLWWIIAIIARILFCLRIVGATIKVKNVGQSALDAYVYTCEVTNILNNEKAKSDIAFTVY